MASILFLSKKDDPFSELASGFLSANCETHPAFGRWNEPLPESIQFWEGDYIISYLSRWIIPETLLNRTRIAAINFHPGPPERPGYGPTAHALYNDDPEFGVTCHHMALRVDTGRIIAVKRFPVFASDDAMSLHKRAQVYLLALFYDVAGLILKGMSLPQTTEQWARPPHLKENLLELERLTPDMSAGEMQKRIRATRYEGIAEPTLICRGIKFRPA